jgi:cullin 3
VSISFRSEKRAAARVKAAFESFLNTDSRAALYLAIYVDELMRSGLKGAGEAEADEMLNRALAIFRYLQDKDVFEAFYKQHLAKRLLGGKSISDEAEKNMVAMLKAECGYQVRGWEGGFEGGGGRGMGRGREFGDVIEKRHPPAH